MPVKDRVKKAVAAAVGTSKPQPSTAPSPRYTGEEDLNAVALVLRVPAQAPWLEVEQELNAQGLTLGWVPACSSARSLGALLEARASGWKSCLYGDLAAQCVALEAQLPDGTDVATRLVPRSAAGPDFKALLVGGRGTTGRIRRANLRVYHCPERTIFRTYACHSPAVAIACLTEMLHRGAMPAVAFVTLPGHAPHPASAPHPLLWVSFEGNRILTEARAAISDRLAQGLQCTAGIHLESQGNPDQTEQDALPDLWTTLPQSPLVQAPSLQLTLPWSELQHLLEQPLPPGVEAVVSHARHARGSLLLRTEVDQDIAPLKRALSALLASTAEDGNFSLDTIAPEVARASTVFDCLRSPPPAGETITGNPQQGKNVHD